MAPDGADSYYMLEFRSSKGLIATTSVFMIFTDVFLYGLVIPVFPFALEERVGIPKEQLHSALSLCIGITGAGILVGSPICGHVTSLCSTRRTPLLFGLFFLFASTCLIRFGTTLPVLVIGRLFGGFAAALTWVAGQALLLDRVHEDETGRYLGLLSVSANAALFFGPILGGGVYETWGYEAVFDIALLLIAFDMLLRSFIIEPKMLKQILSRTNSPTASTTTTAVPTPTEASPLLADVTATAAPLPDLIKPPTNTTTEGETGSERVWMPLLTSFRLLTAIFTTLLLSTVASALETTLPLFAKSEFNYGSKQTGWLFTSLVIPSFTAPIMGYLRDRVLHPHIMILAGFLITAPLFVSLGYIPSFEGDKIALTVFLLLCYGLASTLLTTPISAEFAESVRELEKKGKLRKGGEGLAISYSTNSAAYAAGALFGPFLGGLIKGQWGWWVMTWVLAGVCLVACAPVAGLMVKRGVERREVDSHEEEEGGRIREV